MPQENKLVMRFEAHTIEHLGVKMYSHTPPAIAELIANSYDACAKQVRIQLYSGKKFKIEVTDNGDGMTFDEINNFFLKIGRNRRKENQQNSCERVPTGKKGLGKLALFGLGNKITIITKKEKSKVKFTLDYNQILDWDGTDYTPTFEIEKINDETGTIIILEELKRKTNYPIDEYVSHLSKLFNFKDNNFKVYISLNDNPPIEIHNRLKYENIIPQFEWNYNEIMNIVNSDYENKDKIFGNFITTEKPLKPGLRGITLYANGRMVNSAEFFGRSESSHFYSYLTGWLDIDFIDNYPEDYISTDRQSLNWENEVTTKLKAHLSETLKALEILWRKKRKELKEEKLKAKTNIDIPNWLSKVPEEIRHELQPIIEILNDSQLTTNQFSKTLKGLNTLIPQYPNLHWRHIHSELRNVSEQYYIHKDYYGAFIEALKRYVTEVKFKSGKVNIEGRKLMQAVFYNRILSVTQKYNKSDGSNFDKLTTENIEAAQQMLSEGIIAGGRNPIQHEEIRELNLSGLFSKKDCLDFLSILSHLMNRLDNSVNVRKQSK